MFLIIGSVVVVACVLGGYLLNGGHLVVLFQPHTYTRTAYLFEEWKRGFKGIDALYIAETYAARETPDQGMSAEQLADAIASPKPVYVGTLDEAAERLASDLRPGDVFVTVGAGDVEKVGPQLVERLRGARGVGRQHAGSCQRRRPGAPAERHGRA